LVLLMTTFKVKLESRSTNTHKINIQDLEYSYRYINWMLLESEMTTRLPIGIRIKKEHVDINGESFILFECSDVSQARDFMRSLSDRFNVIHKRIKQNKLLFVPCQIGIGQVKISKKEFMKMTNAERRNWIKLVKVTIVLNSLKVGNK